MARSNLLSLIVLTCHFLSLTVEDNDCFTVIQLASSLSCSYTLINVWLEFTLMWL